MANLSSCCGVNSAEAIRDTSSSSAAIRCRSTSIGGGICRGTEKSSPCSGARAAEAGTGCRPLPAAAAAGGWVAATGGGGVALLASRGCTIYSAVGRAAVKVRSPGTPACVTFGVICGRCPYAIEAPSASIRRIRDFIGPSRAR